MTVAAGARLGPYEIQSALGAGGMGVVYRARDTKLNRDVALKVLPEEFARDADRLARFKREAQVLASLNHPNIAAIYGIEETAVLADGAVARRLQPARALVLELVEGPTLAEVIEARRAGPSGPAGSKGPGLHVDESLAIANQIAGALETAHERGIVHRDLKPANVKVRADGTVKVLDFGLAKAFEGEAAAANASNSPTLSVAATRMGVILGTAAYMAPEQAKGKAVDKRADIWGFGCVLFEMLSGQPPFRGETVSETLAEVMKSEPRWDVLPAGLPARVATVLRRCLEKDPARRVRDIGDVRLALEGAFDAPVGTQHAGVSVAPQAPLWRRAVVPVVTLFVGAAIVGGGLLTLGRPEPSRVTRLAISTTGTAALSVDGVVRDLAITPDGTRVVYIGANGSQLFVRALDALEPTAIAKGAAPRHPFVSPDGQWVGFFDGNIALKKVSITGGPAVTVATIDGITRGATWLPDDTIVFGTSNPTTGLQRVPAAGGTPTVVTRPDRAQGELDHWWPKVLPGGRSVLFTIMARTGGPDAAQVAVLDLETTTYKVLVRGGSDAHYATTGHLVYGTSGTLRAVAFDLARLETRGMPVPVVPEVLTTSSGAVDAVVAADGILAYVSGGAGSVQRILVWVDRQGQETAIPVPPRPYSYPRITPDGKRIGLYVPDQEYDLWLWDLERTTLIRATFEPGIDAYPVWTPDGRRLIFSSDRAGIRNIFWQAADGTGAVERLSESGSLQDPSAVSPDGTRVIFQEYTAANGLDLMELHLDDGSGSIESPPTRQRSAGVTPLVQTPFSELNGAISPDGRWLAYQANDSGQFEIYVRPYPEVSRGLWQVSTGGGSRPAWSRTGQELFYVSPAGALMRVGVERGPTWAAGAPTKFLNEGYYTIPGGNVGRTYDISPDGQRFLMIKAGGGSGLASAPQIVVVQNWLAELKRLVPVD
jgi:Tol biopolymer transport system component/tRNA A-37 threonylcarbamoyl transferase component Bud32